MKIGIVTFWWSEDNYGQLMQCYALQKYLRDAGYQAFLINYDYRQDYPQLSLKEKIIKALNPEKLCRYLKTRIHIKKLIRENEENCRGFVDFRNKYIAQTDRVYYHFEELQKQPPIADVYVVGSDQVWNYTAYPERGIKNVLRAYMLDFAPESAKRMSYAASWGLNKIDDYLKTDIQQMLKKFSYISVREESGVILCKQCGIENAEWVADPTLLLSPEIYRDIYMENEIRKPRGKYILVYMLNNKFKFNVQKVFEFARTKHLEVVYVTGNGVVDRHQKYFATIPEWLYLIDNADYVVTNSFHCCAFSLVFHKKFGAIKLSGTHEGMNTRLDSLFKRMQIKNRYISEDDFSILDESYNCNYRVDANQLINAIEK